MKTFLNLFIFLDGKFNAHLPYWVQISASSFFLFFNPKMIFLEFQVLPPHSLLL